MKKKKDFILLLEDLCNVYRDYVSRENNGKIRVIICDGKICIQLIKDMYLIDEFELSFNDNEFIMYNYVSLSLLRILFDKSVIYNRANLFYNDIDNDYVEFLVNDKFILNGVLTYMDILKDVNFDMKINNGVKIRKKLNNNNYIDSMEERLKISKLLLNDGMK